MEKAEERGVRVFMRVRPRISPALSIEDSIDPIQISGGSVSVSDYRDLDVVTPNELESYTSDPSNRKEHRFDFSGCFDEEANQAGVFEGVGRPAVESLLGGQSGAVVAYGASGTGKSHSVLGRLGDARFEGLLPRACRLIAGRKQNVRLIAAEIFSNAAIDLLAKEVEIGADGNWMAALTAAAARRRRAANGRHGESSRGHGVFSLISGNARLDFVDLAGAERGAACGREGAGINSALSALGKVVLALAKGDSYVPLRDSKLTRIVGPAIMRGGCTLLVCVAPEVHSVPETLATLAFAARASGIRPRLIEARLQSSDRQQSTRVDEDRYDFVRSDPPRNESTRVDPSLLRNQLLLIEEFHCARTLELEREFSAEVHRLLSHTAALEQKISRLSDENRKLSSRTSPNDLVDRQSAALAKMAALLRAKDTEIADLRRQLSLKSERTSRDQLDGDRRTESFDPASTCSEINDDPRNFSHSKPKIFN